MRLAATLAIATALLLSVGYVTRAAMGPGLHDCCAGDTTVCAMTATPATAPSSQPATQHAVYTCPMHPEVTSDKPGKCPKCGMALVKQEDQPKTDKNPHHGHQH